MLDAKPTCMCNEELALFITELCNANHSSFPSSMKSVIVIPVLKNENSLAEDAI